MNKRRHELEENELASFIGKHVGAARENPDDLKKWLVPALLIVIGLCGVWIVFYLVQAMNQATPGAWLNVIVAATGGDTHEQTREELAKIAALPDDPASVWAKQMRADSFLREGSTAMLFEPSATKKKEAQELYASAQEAFAEVRSDAKENPFLLRRATFGEAQAWEGQGEAEKAVALYAELAESAPDTAVGETAKKKLAFLATQSKDGSWKVRPEIEKFFEAYAAYTPQPPSMQGGAGSGFPGMTPPVDPAAGLDELAPSPDLSFPGMEPFLLPPGGEGDGETRGGDFQPGETATEGTDPPTDAPGEEAAPEGPSAETPDDADEASDDAATTAPAAETPAEGDSPTEESAPATTPAGDAPAGAPASGDAPAEGDTPEAPAADDAP